MPKQGKRTESENVDETSAESFPASDPPSWTLGAGASGGSAASALPGTISAPAPKAAVTATADGPLAPEHPSPAELVPTTPPLDLALMGAGMTAAAVGFVLTLAGQERVGRALGRGGTTLLLVAVFRRLGSLGPTGGRSPQPSYH